MNTAIEEEKSKRIGRYIRELRDARHESQTELAEAIGVTRSAICQWENGRTTPSIKNLREIAEHYEVSVDELSEGRNCNLEIDPIKENMIHSAMAIADRLDAAYMVMKKEARKKEGVIGKESGNRDDHT